MSVDVCVALLLLLVFPATTGLRCYDGIKCDYQCNECEGVACIRVVRKQPYASFYHRRQGSDDDAYSPDVAMTCLPAATRDFELEPSGCRTNPVNQLQTCVCYDYDFCNAATRSDVSICWSIGLFHVFQLFRHVFVQ